MVQVHKRVAAWAALAAAAAIGVTACSSKSPSAGTKTSSGTAGASVTGNTTGATGSVKPLTGTITLQTWALTPKYTTYLNKLIDTFQQQHPGVKVKLADQPGDGYSDKVLAQAASNTLPDVINLPPDFALPLAKHGYLEDVSKDTKLSQIYVQGAIDAFSFNGLSGVYGYPWYLGSDVDYWNAKKFDSCGLSSKNPPKTTAELFTQAKTMHEHCPNEYLMSRVPGLGDLTLAGVPILNEQGTKFVFNTDKAAALLDQYHQAYKSGYMPSDVLTKSYLGNSQLFTQGKVAWTTAGATAISDFEKNNPSLRGNIVVSPALDISPLYVQGVSVSKRSAHLATAVAFAEFLTNAANQNAFGHQANVFPSTLASSADPFFSHNDGTSAGLARVTGFNALKTAKVLTPYVVNGAMSDYVTQQIQLAIRGDISGKKALDQSVTKLDQLLASQH